MPKDCRRVLGLGSDAALCLTNAGAVALLLEHKDCFCCASQQFAVKELSNRKLHKLESGTIEQLLATCLDIVVQVTGKNQAPSIFAVIGKLVCRGPRLCGAALHVKGVASVLDGLKKELADTYCLEECCNAVSMSARNNDCRAMLLEGDVVQLIVAAQQAHVHDDMLQIAACKAMATIFAAEPTAAVHALKHFAFEGIVGCALKPHRAEPLVVQGSCGALTWLIRSCQGSGDVTSRAAKLELPSLLLDSIVALRAVESYAGVAAAVDVFHSLIRAADAYPPYVAAASSAGSSGGAGKPQGKLGRPSADLDGAAALARGDDEINGSLPKQLERALVAQKGLAKLSPLASVKPGRLELCKNLVKLLGALFEDHPHAFAPALQHAAVSAGLADLATALLFVGAPQQAAAARAAAGAGAGPDAPLAAASSERLAAPAARVSNLGRGFPSAASISAAGSADGSASEGPRAAGDRVAPRASRSGTQLLAPGRGSSSTAASAASSAGPRGMGLFSGGRVSRSSTSELSGTATAAGAAAGDSARAALGRTASAATVESDAGAPAASDTGVVGSAGADGWDAGAGGGGGGADGGRETQVVPQTEVESCELQAVAALARVAGSAADAARVAIKAVVAAGAVERIAEIALANIGTPDERLRLQEDALGALHSLTVAPWSPAEARVRARACPAFLYLLHAACEAEAAAAERLGSGQRRRPEAEAVRKKCAEMSRAVWHRASLPSVDEPQEAPPAAAAGAPSPPLRVASSLQAVGAPPRRASLGDIAVLAMGATASGPDSPLSPGAAPFASAPQLKARFSWAQGRKGSALSATASMPAGGLSPDRDDGSGGSGGLGAGLQAGSVRRTASQRWAAAQALARRAAAEGAEAEGSAPPADARQSEPAGGAGPHPTLWEVEEEGDADWSAEPPALRRRASAPTPRWHGGPPPAAAAAGVAAAERAAPAKRGSLVNSLHQQPAQAPSAAAATPRAQTPGASAARRIAAALSGVFSRGPGKQEPHPPPSRAGSDASRLRAGRPAPLAALDAAAAHAAAHAAAPGGKAPPPQFKSVLEAMLAEESKAPSLIDLLALPSPVAPEGAPPSQGRRRRASLPPPAGIARAESAVAGAFSRELLPGRQPQPKRLSAPVDGFAPASPLTPKAAGRPVPPSASSLSRASPRHPRAFVESGAVPAGKNVAGAAASAVDDATMINWALSST